MRKLLGVSVLFVFVCGIVFGGCSEVTPNEYVLDSIYENEFYSICYPSDIFYIEDSTRSFKVLSYSDMEDPELPVGASRHNNETQLTFVAVKNSKSSYGDLKSVTDWVESKYDKMGKIAPFRNTTHRGNKAIELRPTNSDDVEKVVFIPLDSWIGVASVYKTDHIEQVNEMLETLIIKKPDFTTVRDIIPKTPFMVYEIDDIWSSLVDDRPLENISWSGRNKYQPVHASKLTKVVSLRVDGNDKEYEITTWPAHSNIFELNLPKDWSLIRFNDFSFVILPNKYLDKPDFLFEKRGDGDFDIDYVPNWQLLYTADAFPDAVPRITIDFCYLSRSVQGNMSVLQKIKPDLKKLDVKKTIFLGFWANKSVTNENGIVVERYDIPLDGWMVTAKIYGVDTNGEVIDEILDSLNFNMNLKTHFSTERFNITHWPEFDSNGNFKDFIELDFKDILKNFE